MECIDWSSLGYVSPAGVGFPGTTVFPKEMWELQGRGRGENVVKYCMGDFPYSLI
jgi:hypothetical protein